MKEKELRLALVCYGGISLAVYMHGISKEILKLARASRSYHGIPTTAERMRSAYADVTPDSSDPIDSEQIYFEFLQQIGRDLDLRVIVDTMAGASAGGINSVLLARAIAHDLSFEHMREMWLREADVSELIATTRRAKRWSKWFMRPIVWLFALVKRREMTLDSEFLTKLSFFVRSRWFQPPFDGEHLLRALYHALEEMQGDETKAKALIPQGHRLDLFVTLTDFFGFRQFIELHDPPQIADREHRHILHFDHMHWPNGEVKSDFRLANIPELAFAARATSSYPGAFPPAQISEVDRLLAHLKRPWESRAEFLNSNFSHYKQADMDPMKTSFVDGSVLNNKPFMAAIDAVKSRPANRDIDRRIIYIDPTPEREMPPPNGEVPGFFRTLKGVLSDIPRNEPIHDELGWIKGFNLRVRRTKMIIDSAKPYVWELVDDITGWRMKRNITLRHIQKWRDAANSRAAEDAGFAYEGYVRLKLDAVLDNGIRLIAAICQYPEGSPEYAYVRKIVYCWAGQKGIFPPPGAVTNGSGSGHRRKNPPWVEFMQRYDIDYRRRRLNFVIQQVNECYGKLDHPAMEGVTPKQLDLLKSHFYNALDLLRSYNDVKFVHVRTAARVRKIFALPESETESPQDQNGPYKCTPEEYAATNFTAIDEVTEQLAKEVDLRGIDHYVDEIFASLKLEEWRVEARREILVAYLGFAYWDLITFSITSWQDLGEFDEILVDRISPEDCNAIREGGAAATLKGSALQSFGAFFSRAHRENDYLWGRLHGAERLLDILYNAAEREGVAGRVNLPALKKRAFEAIVASEREHLIQIPGLFQELEAEIAAIETDPR